MSAKRTKSEKKKSDAGSSAARDFFRLSPLLGVMLAFLSDQELPKMKRTNKTFNSLINTNVKLAERFERGRMWHHVIKYNIIARVAFIEEFRLRNAFAPAHVICSKCGIKVRSLTTVRAVRLWYHIHPDAQLAKCSICAAEDALLNRNLSINEVRTVASDNRRRLEFYDYNTDLAKWNRTRRVKDIGEHFRVMREQFPWQAKKGNDDDGEYQPPSDSESSDSGSDIE